MGIIPRRMMGKIDHSAAGAIHAVQKHALIGKALAYLIAGHHTGLPDWYREPGTGGQTLPERIENKDHHHLQHALQGKPPADILEVSLPTTHPCGSPTPAPELMHLWIRMLYSCLVDADFLDTEAFMNPDKAQARLHAYNLSELKDTFNHFMARKQAGAKDSPVNRARNLILEECRTNAALEPGLFSLTVPTGGGKTLCSMAFALEHAIRFQKKRIIVAIPYTSIIEQTADQYRQIFGNDAVLEHHSNLDPEKGSGKYRLASENWDAPIIVTTNVQLFESLFAAKSSACRKLHNIVNSVIVLDEAQMLPTGYLQPVVSVLELLAEHFRTSIVLCTATQPVLSGRVGTGQNVLKGFKNDGVRELMSDPDNLFKVFQRVTVNMLGDADERHEWDKIAEAITTQRQALCIVNTRKDCRELHGLMPEDTIHLSALMCPEHRSQVIADIKSKLIDGESVRVVSTQLLEAGVDIDFPRVYRAFSGLDSIAQAAGRCNREGKHERGDVLVFNPPKPPPPGIMLKAEQAGKEMFRAFPELATTLMPRAFRQYFSLYYGRLNSFDVQKIMELLVADAPQLNIQFRTAAMRFKLIDDKSQHGVIVRYRSERIDSNPLIDQLRYGGPNRKLMRQLQRFSVNVYDKDLMQLRNNGLIENINGVWVQLSESAYHPVFGLNVDATLDYYW